MVEADLERAEERAEQGEKYVEKKHKIKLYKQVTISSSNVVIAWELFNTKQNKNNAWFSCKFVFCSD